jgi:hypothetical protein
MGSTTFGDRIEQNSWLLVMGTIRRNAMIAHLGTMVLLVLVRDAKTPLPTGGAL